MRTMIVTTLLFCTASLQAQECLHDPTESSEQRSRTRSALQLIRQFNTAQVSSGLQKGKALLPPEQIGVDLTSVPGFSPKFTTDGKTYLLVLKDTTDPCGFALITTEEGLIYRAHPLR